MKNGKRRMNKLLVCLAICGLGGLSALSAGLVAAKEQPGETQRADIIGIRTFYQSIRTGQKAYELALSQGATIAEAVRPYLRESIYQALTPTVATMANVGIVSLPGMMTGVIIGGNDPLTAIGYQIAIMLSIFTGTAITVFLAILLSARSAFSPYGILKQAIFKM
jgi:putative ABC transport system permease protein